MKTTSELFYKSFIKNLKCCGGVFLSSLFFCNVLVAQTANFISNGSFEKYTDCNPLIWEKVENWRSIDSSSFSFFPLSYCNNTVPNQFNTVYQLPKSGNSFAFTTLYYPSGGPNYCRRYLLNRIKAKLSGGQTYCVSFFINIGNTSSYGTDGFAIYFGDESLDTIKYCNRPLSFITPQVKQPDGVPIVDTLGWTAVTGTFVASGTEKYAVIGIFKPNGQVDTASVNPLFNFVFVDACIDDVSCIPLNLPAYAGPDKSIVPGDSVYIGRESDFAIDPGCRWYKLPNLTTAIDTVSGLWVKPVVTTTYVVRQELDCSALKWDTVVVVVHNNLASVEQRNFLQMEMWVMPNPARDVISLESSAALGNCTFQIINVQGLVIREEQLHTSLHPFTTSTHELPPGIYFLRITNEMQNTRVLKFAVAR